MSKTLKIVKASIGSYVDKDGKVKHRYRTIGSVIETKAGEMLIIDVEPRNWDGRAFLNDPEPSTYQGMPKEDDIDF
jgi:hypothetical protein